MPDSELGIAEKAALTILNFLRSIDWNASNETWKQKRVAEFVERAIAESQAPQPAKCPRCFATSEKEAGGKCVPIEDDCPMPDAGWQKGWPTQAEFDAKEKEVVEIAERELGDGEPSPAKSFIDLRRVFADQEWIPSCYMDDGRGGLLLENNTIVLGVGAGFNYEAVKKMATEHNANLRSGAAQEVSPHSWSEQMAQVYPCGHTEAQHMYHAEGYIKLDLSECSLLDGGPSIPAKAEAQKADAVISSVRSFREVSPPSPQSFDEWWAESRKLNPDCGCEQRGQRWFKCSYHEGADDAWDAKRVGDTRELKAALRWIPVEERLPEIPGQYLVWVRGIGDDGEMSRCAVEARFNAKFKDWTPQHGWLSHEVQGWMPMPKPPELG